MMTDEEIRILANESNLIMLSVIINMAIDGNTDLSKLSPFVADYIKGILDDYEGDSGDPAQAQLYWYAHEAFKSHNETIKLH
jgi:hypothetical protein